MIDKRVIVNADDYGLTSEISRGIRDSHKKGIVTSTTTLMNIRKVDQDIFIAREEAPDLGIGVHLNLTLGEPLSPRTEVPTLINKQGRFHTLSEIRELFTTLSLVEVYIEWKAQIDAFIQLDVYPDHLDSHHQISYRHPGLFQVLTDLAEEYKIPIRSNPDHLKPFVRTMSKIVSPDTLNDSFYGENANELTLSLILKSLAEENTEIMTHPGYVDTNLSRISSYTFQRERELDILTSSHIKDVIEEEKLNLINFKQLARDTN